jgi:RNA polymerase sigma-70 factor (ECF subfamily)
VTSPTGSSGDGRRAEVEALFLSTRAPLLAYLRRRVDPDTATELLAEVYLVAWRRHADLPTGDEARLWLFGVARTLVASHHRRAVVHEPFPDDVADPGPAVGGPDTDRVRAVRLALATLSEADRELLTLTTWDGLGVAGAATVLGIRPGTARVRLHRARARVAAHPAVAGLLGPEAPPTPVDPAVRACALAD